MELNLPPVVSSEILSPPTPVTDLARRVYGANLSESQKSTAADDTVSQDSVGDDCPEQSRISPDAGYASPGVSSAQLQKTFTSPVNPKAKRPLQSIGAHLHHASPDATNDMVLVSPKSRLDSSPLGDVTNLSGSGGSRKLTFDDDTSARHGYDDECNGNLASIALAVPSNTDDTDSGLGRAGQTAAESSNGFVSAFQVPSQPAPRSSRRLSAANCSPRLNRVDNEAPFAAFRCRDSSPRLRASPSSSRYIRSTSDAGGGSNTPTPDYAVDPEDAECEEIATAASPRFHGSPHMRPTSVPAFPNSPSRSTSSDSLPSCIADEDDSHGLLDFDLQEKQSEFEIAPSPPPKHTWKLRSKSFQLDTHPTAGGERPRTEAFSPWNSISMPAAGVHNDGTPTMRSRTSRSGSISSPFGDEMGQLGKRGRAFDAKANDAKRRKATARSGRPIGGKMTADRALGAGSAHSVVVLAMPASFSNHNDEETVDDYSGLTRILPTVASKSIAKAISPQTCADLMNGMYDDRIYKYIIIDCRYPFEYVGGHIKGAHNWYSHCDIHKHYFAHPMLPRNVNKRVVIIFHCEFSSERAPKMYNAVRDMDRKLNLANYPFLCYPEMYIIVGGYKAFFADHKELCEPQSYRPMNDPAFTDELRSMPSSKRAGRGKFASYTADSPLDSPSARPATSRRSFDSSNTATPTNVLASRPNNCLTSRVCNDDSPGCSNDSPSF